LPAGTDAAPYSRGTRVANTRVTPMAHLLCRAVLFLVVGLWPMLAAAAPGRVVEIWVARPHTHSGLDEASRERLQRVDLDALANDTVERPDVQYDGTYWYRGVSLGALLDRYAPAQSIDLALLHFANGMVVPWPFRDAAANLRVRLFVARSMALTPEGPFVAGQFEPMAKKLEGAPDVRPIAFSGNHLVAATRFHPDVPARASGFFSPWSQVDSLVGIELVVRAAYLRQLEVPGSAEVRAGSLIFQQSCTFCHAVHGVGGAFGWDFVDPDPIYSDAWVQHFGSAPAHETGYRDPLTSLSVHVRFVVPNSAGRRMPALSHLSASDVRALYSWLRALPPRALPDYDPSPESTR
jgi:mono/diheme cytochrome c family protein